MSVFKHNEKEYLTAYSIAKELGMDVKTVYRRMRFQHSPQRWAVEVREDPKDGELKYCVSRENFNKLWVGSQPEKSLSENKVRILQQQSQKD